MRGGFGVQRGKYRRVPGATAARPREPRRAILPANLLCPWHHTCCATVAAHAPASHVEIKISGEAFLTEPGTLSSLVSAAITDVTGLAPELSTTGGTSDARFIRRLCPVVEFGLPGQSMHKVDEHAAVADVTGLAAIYEAVLARALPH